MKKLIIAFLMIITLAMPLTINATVIDWVVDQVLPEFHGDLNDPDLLVIHKGEDYWVVKINGIYYIFYPNK